MLATSIQLHDVMCVESFVAATLRRSGIHFTADEHEDLVAEGLAILYQLADTWQPRLPGHDQDGRFSGYAAYMLPKRLTDAWHRAHREHSFAADPDTGRRKWVFSKPPVSLDDPFSSEADLTLGDTLPAHSPPAATADEIQHALAAVPGPYRMMARRVVTMTLEGMSVSEMSAALRADPSDVRGVQFAVASAINLPMGNAQ